MENYAQKMVISGKYVDLYKYSRMVICNFSFPQKPEKNLYNNQNGVRSQFSLYRAKNHIINTVNANNQLNKFLTLTFAENKKDVQNANKNFSLFVKKIKYKYKDFQYLAVVEFQARGAVHYHLLCNLPYIQKNILKEIWGYGFIKINRINKIQNLGAYITKYITKSDDKIKLFNQKKYFHSKNLYKPLYITNSWQFQNFFNQFDIKNKKPFYSKMLENKFRGKILIEKYLIK